VNESGAVRTADMEFVRSAQGRLRAADIAIVPWCYLKPSNAAVMARLCADVCVELAVANFIVNAEIEFKRAVDGAARAREFCEAFRGHVPRGRLHLSTFAQPSLHGDFPYAAFLAGGRCDGFMPQCYGSRPTAQVDEAAQVARQYGVALMPTFRAYAGDGREDRAAIVAEAVQMGSEATAAGVQAWNWWHWQSVEAWPEMLEATKGGGAGATNGGRPDDRTTMLEVAARLREEADRLEALADGI